VVLSCAEEREWVRIDVRDTGSGIPQERLESIFDPFVQVDRALNRPHDGVGLGLSISRDLAEGMGGTLVARSKVGAGSTFSLRLRKG
jgi:signal transduction histidine kinase